MSDNRERRFKITKTTLKNFLHIFQNFISYHTTPLQLFFHASLLIYFFSSYNSNISRLFNRYITNLFGIIPYLFFMKCSLFIATTDPPLSLLLIDWKKLWIIVTEIFLKEKTTTQWQLKPFTLCRLLTLYFIFGILVPK